jgi:hypothetical protein
LTSITRPLDKVIFDSHTGRISLEWDTFFNTLQITLNNLLRTGSFAMASGASHTVADTRVTASSFITLSATNAAAASLMAGASSLYITGKSAGVGFDVHTASSAAAGTETFDYWVVG